MIHSLQFKKTPMINIISNNEFFRSAIVELLNQKKLMNYDQNSQAYFYILEIIKNENNLELLINKKKINCHLPMNFNSIFIKIVEELSNQSVDIFNLRYFPLKNSILNQTHHMQLSEIQNLIFMHLSLNLEEGIDKAKLSQIIWPRDKDLSINKLDTHLTNLKNQFAKELNFDFSFISKASKLKLIIN